MRTPERRGIRYNLTRNYILDKPRGEMEKTDRIMHTTNNEDYPYEDLGPLPSPLPMPKNMPLDKGIERLVRILRYHGVQTDQSCEGGEGHVSPWPKVRFNGSKTEGFRALHVAMSYGYKVREITRIWHIDDGEVVGSQWEMILHHTRPE